MCFAPRRLVTSSPTSVRLSILVAARLFCALAALSISLLCGCATHHPAFDRPFAFKQDSFSFANELVWAYQFDPVTGKTTHIKRIPPPTYSHHCFVLARSARQFFQHARFDASLPRAEESAYRQL